MADKEYRATQDEIVEEQSETALDIVDAEFEVETEQLEDHLNPSSMCSSTSSCSSTCSIT